MMRTGPDGTAAGNPAICAVFGGLKGLLILAERGVRSAAQAQPVGEVVPRSARAEGGLAPGVPDARRAAPGEGREGERRGAEERERDQRGGQRDVAVRGVRG